MRRIYFSNADRGSEKTKRIGLLLGTLLLVGLLAVALHYFGSRSETVRNLVDTPKATAQETDSQGGKKQAGETAAEPGDKPAPETKQDSEAGIKAGSDKALTATEIRSKSDALRFREERLKDIQKDITESLSQMRRLQKELDQKLLSEEDVKDEKEKRQLAKLIKIVSSMRAEDAARVIPRMDENLAVKILTSLTGAKASKIMGGLPPEKAASLGARMVKLRPDVKLEDVIKNWRDIVDQIEKEEQKSEQSKRYNTQ